MLLRSCRGCKMNGIRLWLAAVTLQALILSVSSIKTHRRSLAGHQSIPLSKGGWRPVVGSNGYLFGYNTAPLHAPSYKIPVYESYPSSARPLPARDTSKLTSIAQAYRPTTLRTVSPSPSPAASQPINSYLNPFSLPNSGLAHYKFVQNFPLDSVLIRNPHNPYAARPVFKYQTKFKQPFPNQLQFNNYQQLNNVQPIHFGPYQTPKPADTFTKPATKATTPTASAGTEIVKQEVYKLDSDTAPQSVQQVKTAQQQSQNPPRIQASPYPQYTYQESVLPPSILGTFGSFGVQSVKGRDPLIPTKTTYVPPQPTKQTIFNSFSFAPNFKPTAQFVSTTPKLQTTANQIHFGSSWNGYQNPPTQAPKAAVPVKVDPNSNKGGGFKASPQDPFAKPFHDYKVSTYNPNVQTTTFAYNNFHDYNYPSQQNQQIQNYFNQQDNNFNYEKKKHKVHDSVPATNQHLTEQFVSAPKKTEKVRHPDTVPFRANYEVTESYDDVITHVSSPSWQEQHDAFYSQNQKPTVETVTKQDYELHGRPTPTSVSDPPEEVAIVTEGEKGYENSLSYDEYIESQSRRPLGDDFEPIGKHKLKDYYYKVSTPSYESPHYPRRTKKPTETPKVYEVHEVTTQESGDKDNNKDLLVEPLPTLPPNKHFKRPSTPAPETVDKEKNRKRNKIRRRRPGQGNNGQHRDGHRKHNSSTTEATRTTDEATHTIRPRVRPTYKPTVTTPTVTTDLTTSANPTVAPTKPTIVKKKLIHRRPITTTTSTEKYESTTPSKEYDSSKDSSIMKISASSRIPLAKVTSTPYDYRTTETPDYTHKQDEKDTPTSDIAVDTLKTTTKAETVKPFSFHRDTKPIEAKLEPVVREITTTESTKESSESVDDVTTTTPRAENASSPVNRLRPRLKNKYGRPNFSVKDYRNRLSSTTSTTEKPADSEKPRLRYPPRKPITEKLDDVESTTERKKFTPKDPRHKLDGTEINEQGDKEIHTQRPNRHKQTTDETTEAATPKISARIRNGSRRPKPTEETIENTTPLHSKRPLRKKIKDSEVGESVQDIAVTETTVNSKNDITSERTRSESAIMKIADKKHQDHIESIFEHSKRVSDLTLAASKDYNTPGLFKTVNTNSRRIPNYFTIATDDPILPIEAFFPQLNQKKES